MESVHFLSLKSLGIVELKTRQSQIHTTAIKVVEMLNYGEFRVLQLAAGLPAEIMRVGTHRIGLFTTS